MRFRLSSEITIRSSESTVRTDIPFFLYFVLMYPFYVYTYVQLGLQLALIGYVLFVRMKKWHGEIPGNVTRNILRLTAWFGLFMAVAMLSTTWAVYVKEGSSTLLTLFRIYAIGVTMYLYMDDYYTVLSVIRSLVMAMLVLGVVIFLRTPLSAYGNAGSDGFGRVIHMHRNTVGAIFAFLAPLCYVKGKTIGLRFSRLAAVFCAVVVVCTGSRTAIIQLPLFAFFELMISKTDAEKVRKIMYICAAGVLFLFASRYIPYLKTMVWNRLDSIYQTLIGSGKNYDSSANSRFQYIKLGWIMFKTKPLLGYGVDGFYVMTGKIKELDGETLRQLYSHCNYAEIGSCFGLLGLAVWYIPVLKILKTSFEWRHKSDMMKFVCASWLTFLVMDWGRIPWEMHHTMYLLFLMNALYYAEIDQLKRFYGNNSPGASVRKIRFEL